MNTVYAQFGDTDIGAGSLTGISTLSDLFGLLINLVFGIGLATAVIFVIVCGIKFSTSAGDPGKRAEAQQCLIWALAAAVIIVGFKLVPALVFNILGLEDPATIIST